jgi:hypothetical protein
MFSSKKTDGDDGYDDYDDTDETTVCADIISVRKNYSIDDEESLIKNSSDAVEYFTAGLSSVERNVVLLELFQRRPVLSRYKQHATVLPTYANSHPTKIEKVLPKSSKWPSTSDTHKKK